MIVLLGRAAGQQPAAGKRRQSMGAGLHATRSLPRGHVEKLEPQSLLLTGAGSLLAAVNKTKHARALYFCVHLLLLLMGDLKIKYLYT